MFPSLQLDKLHDRDTLFLLPTLVLSPVNCYEETIMSLLCLLVQCYLAKYFARVFCSAKQEFMVGVTQ